MNTSNTLKNANKDLSATEVGAWFSGQLGVGEQERWINRGWQAHLHIIWTVIPTSASLVEEPQINWSVEIERTADGLVTYWITVINVSRAPVLYEGRYAILNPD